MNVDASEFEGNIEELFKSLQKKLRGKIVLNNDVFQIEQASTSRVRDLLKQTLHKFAPNSYRVISKSGVLKIKKIEARSHKTEKSKGTPPSAPQSMPYFFPR